ncbi:unnamed protein product, partial [Meganyctiphanes norvegica]
MVQKSPCVLFSDVCIFENTTRSKCTLCCLWMRVSSLTGRNMADIECRVAIITMATKQKRPCYSISNAYFCGVPGSPNGISKTMPKDPQSPETNIDGSQRGLIWQAQDLIWSLNQPKWTKLDRIKKNRQNRSINEKEYSFLADPTFLAIFWRKFRTFFTFGAFAKKRPMHCLTRKIRNVNFRVRNMNIGCQLDCQTRNQIPDLPETFICMWQDCQYQFTSAQEFYWHVQSHAISVDPVELKNGKKYICSWGDCTSKLNNQLRLKDHMRTHTQEKLVGCPNCGGIFASNTKFYDHCYKQLHHDLKNYQCSHCSRKFSHERLLRDHVRTHINHFKCPQCDMTCPTKVTLLAHIQYRHSDSKPHQCELCEKRFKALYDLSRHMVVHSKENFYRCTFEDCTRTFRAQSSLNAHVLKTHHGMGPLPFGCHVCERQFASGHGLSKHLIKAHNFRLPEGHTRFKYKQDENGLFRLQMTRYESIELTQENQAEVLSIAGEHADEVLSITSDIPPSSPYSMYAPATPASGYEPNTPVCNTPSTPYDPPTPASGYNPPTPGSSAYYNPATPVSVAASSTEYGTPTSSAPTIAPLTPSAPDMPPLTPFGDSTTTHIMDPLTPGASDHVSLEEFVPEPLDH